MKVSFLVDGFNLCHCIRAAQRQSGIPHLKWLDLRGLCGTLVSSGFGPGERLEATVLRIESVVAASKGGF